MTQKELYGNWLCPPPLPGKRVVRQPGIYLSGRSANASHFRSGSPDSFADEEDYDDVIMSETEDQMQQGLPGYEGNAEIASQRSKEGTGVYVLAGQPAPSSLPQKAVLFPDSNQEIGYREKSIVTLYILMGICFAMWAVLLSLAVVKYSEMSEELKVLNYNHSERLMNVLQDLDAARKERDRIECRMNKSYQEFWDFKASICSTFPESVKCAANWQKSEKACYYFSNMSKDWRGAKQFCTEQVSHLVIINNDNEQGFLKDRNKNMTYWLGLSDIEEEGKWRWEDNSQFSTSFWHQGEPNAEVDEEDCVSMWPDGAWRDSKCSMEYHWICEKTWVC